MTDPTTGAALAAVARIRQMTDAWEQRLPETIRTPAVVSALRAALEAVPAVSLPPADQTTLRDRIAEAVVRLHETGGLYALDAGEDGRIADAVLAVLPAPPVRAEYDALVAEADRLRRDGAALHAKAVNVDTRLAELQKQVAAPVDRAAVLREAADRMSQKAAAFTEGLHDLAHFVAKDRLREAEILDREAAELRRMADETPAAETPWPIVTDFSIEVWEGDTWVGVTYKRKTIEEARERRDSFRRRFPEERLRIVRWDETPTVVEADPEPAAGARQGETAADQPGRCAHCTHPKSDHDGRADHRAKYPPHVAGEPWCHACNAPCDYAAGARQDGAQPNPREVCICGHTRSEHGTVSGRLLCGVCDPDSTENLACQEFEAL